MKSIFVVFILLGTIALIGYLDKPVPSSSTEIKEMNVVTTDQTAMDIKTSAVEKNHSSSVETSEKLEVVDEQLSPQMPIIETNKEDKKETVEVIADGELNHHLILVNKERALPPEYVPPDLVEPDVPFPFEEDLPKRLMRKEAAKALEELFEQALKENLDLYAQSGYRSYNRQESIFAFNVESNGEEHANQVSARAGQSEHQTGLAMDVTSPGVKFQLTTAFEKTKEGQWVKEHAPDFGFIIRYPKGKEEITGYQYEPWHLRFVGKEAAQQISDQGLTLEEYLRFNSDTR